MHLVYRGLSSGLYRFFDKVMDSLKRFALAAHPVDKRLFNSRKEYKMRQTRSVHSLSKFPPVDMGKYKVWEIKISACFINL